MKHKIISYSNYEKVRETTYALVPPNEFCFGGALCPPGKAANEPIGEGEAPKAEGVADGATMGGAENDAIGDGVEDPAVDPKWDGVISNEFTRDPPPDDSGAAPMPKLPGCPPNADKGGPPDRGAAFANDEVADVAGEPVGFANELPREDGFDLGAAEVEAPLERPKLPMLRDANGSFREATSA
jgi:hypothetical protein